MKYLDTKENSIEDSVTRVLMGEKKLDPVNPTAVKKKFDDRKDMDIDNDGDVDSTDKYLHKRRKAISKAIKNDKPNKLDEILPALAAIGTAKAVGKVAKAVGGDIQKKKNNNVRENVKDIAMMMRDKKYKGRTSAFDAAVKKKYPKEYDTNAVQDLIRKHAEMNEQMMFDEGKKLKSGVDVDFELYSDPKKKSANMAMNKEIRRAQMMKDYKTARAYMDKVQKKYSELGAEDSEADRTIDKILGVVFGKVNMGADKKLFEYVELDENFRKLAVMGIGTETKKGAKVGQSMDYYLPKTGDKSTGKIMRVSKDGYEIENDGELTPRLKGKRHKFKFYDPTSDKTSVRGMRKENYEIGNDYAKHTLRVTPGQLESDVDDMLGIAQKKNLSMRETLAKLWGMTESKNPFEKKVNEKEHDMDMVKKVTKTMTGKKPTPVEVDPKTGE